jgi:hypothetical protein
MQNSAKLQRGLNFRMPFRCQTMPPVTVPGRPGPGEGAGGRRVDLLTFIFLCGILLNEQGGIFFDYDFPLEGGPGG